ncbi:MAG: hypothetical protein DHS20C16_34470 [Phycisphaerae bacterium]|nr:MAG: hypothetical protein DHS20C16_34470 [Phycisphaerae bacterium]
MNNACTTGHMQFHDLASYYHESADALVTHAQANHRSLDSHVYAICFLYRHSFELMLKELICKSKYLNCGKSDWAMSHGLSILWRTARKGAREALADDYPLSEHDESQIADYFGQIEEHDSNSFSFRYPYDSKQNSTLSELRNVNIRVLQENSKTMAEHLEKLASMVQYMFDGECEQRQSNS